MIARKLLPGRLLFALTLVLAAGLGARVGIADNQETWTVIDAVGDVRLAIATSGEIASRPLRQGDRIDPGQTFVTGGNASAKLVRGNDLMIVQPGSVVRLPAVDTSLSTRIQQRLGRVLYQVEPRENPNFSVETPLLVAVVKGTRFEVVISSDGTQVNVAEGVVETIERASGATFDVAAGRSAAVAQGTTTPMTVIGSDGETIQALSTISRALDGGLAAGGGALSGAPSGASNVASDGVGGGETIGGVTDTVGGLLD